jgi:glutaryl-CoA dehydrogenase
MSAQNSAPKEPMFNYLDALVFDDQLTEEERTLRDQARAYCTTKLMPRVVQAFRDESRLNKIITEKPKGVSR